MVSAEESATSTSPTSSPTSESESVIVAVCMVSSASSSSSSSSLISTSPYFFFLGGSVGISSWRTMFARSAGLFDPVRTFARWAASPGLGLETGTEDAEERLNPSFHAGSGFNGFFVTVARGLPSLILVEP